MISVTILTKNSSKYLEKVLEALILFDEVLIFDNGSTDETLEIASRYSNVTIQQGNFEGFGVTHNRASSLARNDWILSVDSDEIVSPQMAAEILHMPLDSQNVYSFPRHNYFNGRYIRWCGWCPDRQLRLYHRKKTAFTNARVHEAIIVGDLNCVALQSPLLHYSYESISDFLVKMQTYSTLFAEQYGSKRSSSPLKAVGHGLFAFFKSYILKRGFMGGYEGYLISAYNGHTAFYKYLKLYEANLRLKAEKSANSIEPT
jgi:glycosyltransferase involved in cell wall biosynthesis